MFARIYFSLLCLVLVAAAASFTVYDLAEDSLQKEHDESILRGTFTLIREGASRQEGSKQVEWLSLVSRLSGFQLQLKGFDDPVRPSSLQHKPISVISDDGPIEVWLRLQGDSKDKVVRAIVPDLAEQQLRVAALLLVNDLNRFAPPRWKERLEELSQIYAFPVQKLAMTQTGLDNSQVRRLRRGEVVVQLPISSDANSAFQVFAAISQQSDTVLVLGPIPAFKGPSETFLGILVVIAVLVCSLGAYLLVRRVERRVDYLSELAQKLGSGEWKSRADETGADSLSNLSRQLNDMAGRIEHLVSEQKHMTQAISHELRTPISRIKFRLDSLRLKAEEQGDERSLERIQGIQNDLAELHALIDETLVFHELDNVDQIAQTLIEQSNEFSIKALVDRVVESSLLVFPDMTIEVAIADDAKVFAWPKYYERLIQNLIQNALRHGEQRVRVSFESADDGYQLCVEDDGAGIPEQDRATVFSPFSRLDSSRNKKSGGYGLGLAIVKRIAELHQGEMSVESSDMGGAKFLLQVKT